MSLWPNGEVGATKQFQQQNKTMAELGRGRLTLQLALLHPPHTHTSVLSPDLPTSLTPGGRGSTVICQVTCTPICFLFHVSLVVLIFHGCSAMSAHAGPKAPLATWELICANFNLPLYLESNLRTPPPLSPPHLPQPAAGSRGLQAPRRSTRCFLRGAGKPSTGVTGIAPLGKIPLWELCVLEGDLRLHLLSDCLGFRRTVQHLLVHTACYLPSVHSKSSSQTLIMLCTHTACSIIQIPGTVSDNLLNVLSHQKVVQMRPLFLRAS